MAFGDYGGMAFLNGRLRVDRCGWRQRLNAHVLLGDGPVWAGLFKQDGLTIELGDCTQISGPWHGVQEIEISLAGHRLHARWEDGEDGQSYLYVRLICPGGGVWCGFSGYGVGYDMDGYPFSTEDRVKRLFELFPPPGSKR